MKCAHYLPVYPYFCGKGEHQLTFKLSQKSREKRLHKITVRGVSAGLQSRLQWLWKKVHFFGILFSWDFHVRIWLRAWLSSSSPRRGSLSAAEASSSSAADQRPQADCHGGQRLWFSRLAHQRGSSSAEDSHLQNHRDRGLRGGEDLPDLPLLRRKVPRQNRGHDRGGLQGEAGGDRRREDQGEPRRHVPPTEPNPTARNLLDHDHYEVQSSL